MSLLTRWLEGANSGLWDPFSVVEEWGSAKEEARGIGRPKSRLWDERCGSFPGRSRFTPLSEQRLQGDELGFRDGRSGDSRTGTGERSNSGNFDPYFRGIADIFYERVRVTSYVSETP